MPAQVVSPAKARSTHVDLHQSRRPLSLPRRQVDDRGRPAVLRQRPQFAVGSFDELAHAGSPPALPRAATGASARRRTCRPSCARPPRRGRTRPNDRGRIRSRPSSGVATGSHCRPPSVLRAMKLSPEAHRLSSGSCAIQIHRRIRALQLDALPTARLRRKAQEPAFAGGRPQHPRTILEQTPDAFPRDALLGSEVRPCLAVKAQDAVMAEAQPRARHLARAAYRLFRSPGPSARDRRSVAPLAARLCRRSDRSAAERTRKLSRPSHRCPA